MRYSINTDSDGYVQNIFVTGNPRRDVYILDLSLYDLTGLRKYAYKVGKNELIFDETRYNSLVNDKTRKENDKEISYLKEQLTETDYIVARAFEEVMQLENPVTWIVDVIKIMLRYSAKYRATITNRKLWRKRIEELE